MVVLPQTIIPLARTYALRNLTLRLTRDGEITSSTKIVLVTDKNLVVQAVFATAYEQTQTLLASVIDGNWLLIGLDFSAPQRSVSRFPTINSDVVFALDFNDGTGGASGAPATMGARVRVDSVDVAREILAVERQTDGAWRIAGNLRTADGSLDLRVTGGEVYAMALDDYGYVYQPNLAVAVGDTIRPTVYAGWLYRITEPGTLPATEPEWWPIDGDNAPRLLGTARAVAVRYYRPLAHGPVPVEMI